MPQRQTPCLLVVHGKQADLFHFIPFRLMSAWRSISVQLSRVAAVTHVAGKAATTLHLMLQGRDENRKDKAQKTGLCLSGF